jgi:hypothetical protein
MSELEVNMAQMAADAEGFTDISTAAEDITTYMQKALALLGKFWGNDLVGDTFFDQWDPATSGLLDTMSGFGDGMLATSLGVINSANLYKKSNDINSELI